MGGGTGGTASDVVAAGTAVVVAVADTGPAAELKIGLPGMTDGDVSGKVAVDPTGDMAAPNAIAGIGRVANGERAGEYGPARE